MQDQGSGVGVPALVRALGASLDAQLPPRRPSDRPWRSSGLGLYLWGRSAPALDLSANVRWWLPLSRGRLSLSLKYNWTRGLAHVRKLLE